MAFHMEVIAGFRKLYGICWLSTLSLRVSLTICSLETVTRMSHAAKTSMGWEAAEDSNNYEGMRCASLVDQTGNQQPPGQLEPFQPTDVNESLKGSAQHNIERTKLEQPAASTNEGGRAKEISHRPQDRSGFLQLPVEIRLYIYELSFHRDATLAQEMDYSIRRVSNSRDNVAKILPPQAAITRVSRLIRQESLDYWYSTVRFQIQFRLASWRDTSVGPWDTPSYELIRVGPDSVYSRARKLELSFESSYGIGVDKAYLCFTMELNERTNSYTIEHTPWTRDSGVRRPQALRRAERFKQHFDGAIAEMIVEAGGIKKLTLRSYEHLVPQPSWRFWRKTPDQDDK